MADVIRAEGLVKTYGKLRALDGLDLQVPEATVLALLGPNGAGKTTAVRVLTTLLKADGGTATVAGLDVLRQARGGARQDRALRAVRRQSTSTSPGTRTWT